MRNVIHAGAYAQVRWSTLLGLASEYRERWIVLIERQPAPATSSALRLLHSQLYIFQDHTSATPQASVSLQILHLVSACHQLAHKVLCWKAPVQLCQMHSTVFLWHHVAACSSQCTFEVQVKLWTDGAQMQYDPQQRASCLVRANTAAEPHVHHCLHVQRSARDSVACNGHRHQVCM
jgi:hypothetical protein